MGSWERVGRTQGGMQSVVLVGIWEMPSKIQEEGWAEGTCWRYAYELRPLPPDLLAPQIPWPHAHAVQEQLEVCALQEVTPWPNIIVGQCRTLQQHVSVPHVFCLLSSLQEKHSSSSISKF